MTDFYHTAITNAAAAGTAIEKDTALAILSAPAGDMPDIMAAANRLRRQYFGDKVHLCSILNAKSGACGEDCAFCAQAGRHKTDAETFPLCPEPEIRQAYKSSQALPVDHFGVVTSGGALSRRELDTICHSIRQGQRDTTHWCASLGCLNREQLQMLKDAGLKRFHHNLETAASYFPKICTTHTYEERLATVRAAKEIGLEICCGGILGMGESMEQRVEFAFTLQKEGVDAIPLNFLIPIKGTAMANRAPLTPMNILRILAMFRLVNPRAEIKVCAGRLLLRDLQSMIFQAGATGMMIGPLLTVAGRDVESDLQMLRDLEVDYE